MKYLKLGGLTWWRNNYGSILQAYALQTIIKQYKDVEYEIICQYGRQATSLDNLVDKLRKIGFWGTIRRAFWKVGIKKLRVRNEVIQKFVNEKLIVSKKTYSEESIYEANDDYDGFVCGSDQIWNPSISAIDSIYWLKFSVPDKLKFSYAPSIGSYNLSKEQQMVIYDNLKDFRAISCREENGTELINKVLGENRCVTVLDPTLIVDCAVWNEICTPSRFDKPYIFSYILRGTREQRKLIEEFASRKELEIVTISFLEPDHIELYDFKFGDIRCWDASPADFITLIRNATYVFTDSFHCMVFSCLYHVTFWTFPKKGKFQLDRIVGLQKKLHIPSRMIVANYSVTEIEAMKEIDWEEVETALTEEKEISLRYLDGVLKANQYMDNTAQCRVNYK